MIQRAINKVLIANRGEIALRIQRACKKLGIKSALIVSSADKHSFAARCADEVFEVGPAPAKQSYLNIERIIEAAKALNCDAVHPGYGFMSENGEFAQRVIDQGLIFIGPRPEAIKTMGSKTAAREKVQRFKVPVVPGSDGGLTNPQILLAAKKIGFPVIVKAASGGGGRGMRIAHTHKELEEALPRAREEALKFFSNESVYIEKYIEKPRHVEVQVFGDQHGNLIHLGTRDCSTQRRHQKLIEEAPAPYLSDKLRNAIHKAAINAAKSVNYSNAGTIEFLVTGNKFYFLEMNTRIQVEHPVTEEVTGLDLVDMQIRVARGEKLPVTQKQVRFDGHAIEFRVYAENPYQGFSPAKGKIIKWTRPDCVTMREDCGYEQGDEVSLHYDAMLSKIIVKAPNRALAIEESRIVLSSYAIVGVPTSLDLARWLLENGLFSMSTVDIGFVEREFTSQAIRDLRAQLIRDPAHIKPIGGALMRNEYTYRSEKYNTTYTIEVLHSKDGFFLAVPKDAKGRKAANKYCRRSNGFNAVIKTLINDVLETEAPSSLFQQ